MIELKIGTKDSSFIKRRKAIVLERYCPTHSKSLEQANELAVYIYSMGRPNEVEMFLDSYCENSPFVAPRWQWWEAACYAMLFSTHLKRVSGDIDGYRRLLAIVQNDHFDPFPWIKDVEFDEYLEATCNLPEWGPFTHHEKCQIRAQSFLGLLYSMYIGSKQWAIFRHQEKEIENELSPLLDKINELVVGK